MQGTHIPKNINVNLRPHVTVRSKDQGQKGDDGRRGWRDQGQQERCAHGAGAAEPAAVQDQDLDGFGEGAVRRSHGFEEAANWAEVELVVLKYCICNCKNYYFSFISIPPIVLKMLLRRLSPPALTFI